MKKEEEKNGEWRMENGEGYFSSYVQRNVCATHNPRSTSNQDKNPSYLRYNCLLEVSSQLIGDLEDISNNTVTRNTED